MATWFWENENSCQIFIQHLFHPCSQASDAQFCAAPDAASGYYAACDRWWNCGFTHCQEKDRSHAQRKQECRAIWSRGWIKLLSVQVEFSDDPWTPCHVQQESSPAHCLVLLEWDRLVSSPRPPNSCLCTREQPILENVRAISQCLFFRGTYCDDTCHTVSSAAEKI